MATKYVTYFDSGYLSRGIALIDSMRQHGELSDVHVLCLDQPTQDYLSSSQIDGVFTFAPTDLVSYEPELLGAKENRSLLEYYFTCTPQVVRYVMDKFSDIDDVVVYLDADLYFFNNPLLVIDALGNDSVGIIEHGYSPENLDAFRQFGLYNVGWVAFRNDEKGKSCLTWWADSCLEWCFDVAVDGKFADQGYLDYFPQMFDGVGVLKSFGFNLAPWNMYRAGATFQNGSDYEPLMLSDGNILCFFHMHGLRKKGIIWTTGETGYGYRLSSLEKKAIYKPYIARLCKLNKEISFIPSLRTKHPKNRGATLNPFRKYLRDMRQIYRSLLAGNVIVNS